MKAVSGRCGQRGFTLIELLAALLILSLLALMSHRGLGAVLEARQHLSQESAKWRRIAAFSARFEQDVKLAAPRPARGGGGITTPAPAWLGRPPGGAGTAAQLSFSRFAAIEGVDSPRRVAYGLSASNEIELWLWPGLDLGAEATPQRHALLGGVSQLEFAYLNADLAWVGSWPNAPGDAPIPRAVRLRIGLASGEQIERIFELAS